MPASRPGIFIPGVLIPMCPRLSDEWWCWNLDPLSIGYAFRPHLRSRLSRRRSALRRKPWIFGRKDSHLPLATHSGILSSVKSTVPYSSASLLTQCSPTNPQIPRLRWCVLAPCNFRRRNSRLVSYYALFECVAASEPTS